MPDDRDNGRREGLMICGCEGMLMKTHERFCHCRSNETGEKYGKIWNNLDKYGKIWNNMENAWCSGSPLNMERFFFVFGPITLKQSML